MGHAKAMNQGNQGIRGQKGQPSSVGSIAPQATPQFSPQFSGQPRQQSSYPDWAQSAISGMTGGQSGFPGAPIPATQPAPPAHSASLSEQYSSTSMANNQARIMDLFKSGQLSSGDAMSMLKSLQSSFAGGPDMFHGVPGGQTTMAPSGPVAPPVDRSALESQMNSSQVPSWANRALQEAYGRQGQGGGWGQQGFDPSRYYQGSGPSRYGMRLPRSSRPYGRFGQRRNPLSMGLGGYGRMRPWMR